MRAPDGPLVLCFPALTAPPPQGLSTELPHLSCKQSVPFTTLESSATHMVFSSVCWWAVQNVQVIFHFMHVQQNASAVWTIRDSVPGREKIFSFAKTCWNQQALCSVGTGGKAAGALRRLSPSTAVGDRSSFRRNSALLHFLCVKWPKAELLV